MSKCCGPKASPSCGASSGPCQADGSPLDYFAGMIDHCYQAAVEAKAQGRPVVGILCEYTPRELVLAAGGLPVCLCGGSLETIGPAEEDLPANLCPLIKSTYGYHVTRSNPFLEMADLVVAETTCDGKKKMYELMGRSRPVFVLELPQKPHEPEARAHWLAQLVRLREHLRTRFGQPVSDDCLRHAIALMNQERSLRRRLAELMRSDSPPLTGRELLQFKSSISGLSQDLAQYARALEFYAGRSGPCERAARVRVLLTGVPTVHGAERVLDVIEDNGGLIVCMESCTGVKPILEDVDASAPDPLAAVADKYLHLPCSVMTPNDDRLASLRDLAAQYRPECVIELTWQACLTYDVESARVRKFVQEQLGLPYLKITTDYSPSDTARIAVRVEALMETVRERRPRR